MVADVWLYVGSNNHVQRTLAKPSSLKQTRTKQQLARHTKYHLNLDFQMPMFKNHPSKGNMCYFIGNFSSEFPSGRICCIPGGDWESTGCLLLYIFWTVNLAKQLFARTCRTCFRPSRKTQENRKAHIGKMDDPGEWNKAHLNQCCLFFTRLT